MTKRKLRVPKGRRPAHELAAAQARADAARARAEQPVKKVKRAARPGQQAPQRDTPQSGDSNGSMPAALRPTLPPDVMARIMRAALAADGDDVRAWVRLSLVSRTWRDGLRGASSRAASRA